MILTNVIWVVVVALFLFAMLVVATVVYKKEASKTISIKTVHAGSGGLHTFSGDASSVQICPFTETFYDKRKKKVDIEKYEIRLVDKNCMAPRGIVNGNLVFIEKFKEGEEKKISKGDILFIKREKDGYPYYKLREFYEFNVNGEAITFYYDAHDGSPQKSSSPHSLENIDGVVKMKFEYKC